MDYTKLSSEHFPSIEDENNFTAKELVLSGIKRAKIFIYKNPQNNNVCLMKADTDYEKLPRIKGLFLSFSEFGRPGEQKDVYVKMECTNSSYNDIFTKIVINILKDHEESNSDIVSAIKNTLRKWKAFFDDFGKKILTEEDITGLIGELSLLKEIQEIEGNTAVNYWVADKGGNDFILSKKLIEVKATIKEKHEHVINGIDQLLEIREKEKYILSIIFSRTNSPEALSLPSLVEYFSEKLQGDYEMSDIFYERLSARGYDMAKADEYLSYSYHLIRGGYYKLDHNIPRLTTNELKKPLDSRISKVRYSLNLEGLENDDFNIINTKKIFFDEL